MAGFVISAVKTLAATAGSWTRRCTSTRSASISSSARSAARKFGAATWRALTLRRHLLLAAAIFALIATVVPIVTTLLGWLTLWVACLMAAWFLTRSEG